MTIQEIFQSINAKQIEGMMFHTQMTDAFDFLGLRGFHKWQKHQLIDETKEMLKISHKYLSLEHKLLPLSGEKIKVDISPIPEKWYEKKTSDIDKNSISEAVKALLNKYVDWEKGVKEKYTACAKELMSLEYEDDLEKYDFYVIVRELAADVRQELECVRELQAELEAIDYDSLYIKQIQERYCVEYK